MSKPQELTVGNYSYAYITDSSERPEGETVTFLLQFSGDHKVNRGEGLDCEAIHSPHWHYDAWVKGPDGKPDVQYGECNVCVECQV